MARIFISYKRVDKDRVFLLRNKIEAEIRERCWIDLEGIESDAQFRNVIIRAINDCEVFLFMYSKTHSLITDFEGDWTFKELNFAASKNKRIVFINIDGTPLTDVFIFDFKSKQQIDGQSQESIQRLINDLKKWLNIPEVENTPKTDNSQKSSQKQVASEVGKKPQPANDSNGYINGHEWVDLGLSVKWATCNVGATSPEEYGDYFAWGETSAKSSYDGDNSLTYDKSNYALRLHGIIDPRGIISKRYDAANVNWGASWRMPTKDEIDELVNKCKWHRTTLGGKAGYRVTGANGNSIFLPAAGIRFGASLRSAGDYGGYWGSSVYDSTIYAYGLSTPGGYRHVERGSRFYGLSVRPVSE